MNVTPLDFEKPILELTKKLEDLKRHLRGQEIDLDPEVRRIAAHIDKTKRQIYANLNSWQRVQIARHPQRPYALDYLRLCFQRFRRIARRPPLRRRPRDDRRAGDHRRHPLRGGRAPERARHEGEHPAQFRLRPSRGLPQGAADHAAGGEIRLAGRGA